MDILGLKDIYFSYSRYAWGSLPCVLCGGKGNDPNSMFIFPQITSKSEMVNGKLVFEDKEVRRNRSYGRCFQCEAVTIGPQTVPRLFHEHKDQYNAINMDKASIARRYSLFSNRRIPSIERNLKHSDIAGGILVARTHCRNCEKDKLSHSAYICMREMVTKYRRDYALWYRCARCGVCFSRCTPTMVYWATEQLSTLEWVDMDRFQFYDRLGISADVAEKYNRIVMQEGNQIE